MKSVLSSASPVSMQNRELLESFSSELLNQQKVGAENLESLKLCYGSVAVALGHPIDFKPPSTSRALSGPLSGASNSSADTVDLPSGTQEISESFSDLYILYQGSVRLLCYPGNQPKGRTIQRLEAGDIFGADFLFVENPLGYRAIASSACEIIPVSETELACWISDSPQLRNYLSNLVKARQQIIFFRQFTNLSSLPSLKLRQLASYLIEQTIPVNTVISDVCKSNAGYFWLCEGEVISQTQSSVEVGTKWGGPHPIPDDWVAASDIRIYHLPIHYWEQAKSIIPALVEPEASSKDGASCPSRAAAGEYSGRIVSQTPGMIQSERSLTQNSLAQAPPTSPASEPLPVVLFPKPIHRRVFDFIGKFPWIEQQSSSDCGAACLAIICRYWGKRLPIYALRTMANVGQSGASLKSLAQAAESLGFQSRPVRASLGKLADQENPWIAHWDGDHYVVVFGVRNDRMVISDPAMGRLTLSKQEFSAHWTGYGILLSPTEQFREIEIKQASFNRYLSAIAPYRGIVLQIIVASLLIQVFSLVTPLFTQIILDTVVVQKSPNTLTVFVIGLLLFGIGGTVLSSVRQYLLSYFANRLDLTLISGFIHHTLSLPLSFFESRQVGDIITRVQENQKIQQFLVGRLILAWLGVLTGFVYLALMLYYKWQLTLLILAMIPPIVILAVGSTPFLRRVSREIFKESAAQNSSLVEMLSGISTLKSTATEQELRWRW